MRYSSFLIQYLMLCVLTSILRMSLPPSHSRYMLTFQRMLEVLLPSPLGSSRLLSPTPHRRPTRGRAASGACTERWGRGGGLAAGDAQDLGTSSPPLFPKLGWKRLGHTLSPPRRAPFVACSVFLPWKQGLQPLRKSHLWHSFIASLVSSSLTSDARWS